MAVGAFDDVIKKVMNGTVMEGNKAINSLLGAYSFGAKVLDGQDATKAFNKTFKKVSRDSAGKALKDEAGNKIRQLDYGKLAGGYIGLAAGARVLGGGGVYRDNSGGTNLIGVPFV